MGLLLKATRERLDGVGLLDMTFVSEVAAEGVEELAKIFLPYLGMVDEEANDWAAFFEATEVARRSVVYISLMENDLWISVAFGVLWRFGVAQE